MNPQTTVRWFVVKLLLYVYHRTSVFKLPQQFHKIRICVRRYIRHCRPACCFYYMPQSLDTFKGTVIYRPGDISAYIVLELMHRDITWRFPQTFGLNMFQGVIFLTELFISGTTQNSHMYLASLHFFSVRRGGGGRTNLVHADISRDSSQWIRSRRLWCRPLPWWHTVGAMIAAASHVSMPRDLVSKQLREEVPCIYGAMLESVFCTSKTR